MSPWRRERFAEKHELGTALAVGLGTLGMLVQFKGQREKELTAEARGWFEEMVVQTIYPEAERLVREHLDAGHIVVIISGATRFVVQPLAERLGVDHFLYTRLEVEDGVVRERYTEVVLVVEGPHLRIGKLRELSRASGATVESTQVVAQGVDLRAGQRAAPIQRRQIAGIGEVLEQQHAGLRVRVQQLGPAIRNPGKPTCQRVDAAL